MDPRDSQEDTFRAALGNGNFRDSVKCVLMMRNLKRVNVFKRVQHLGYSPLARVTSFRAKGTFGVKAREFGLLAAFCGDRIREF
jgi:hypothetical protein